MLFRGHLRGRPKSNPNREPKGQRGSIAYVPSAIRPYADTLRTLQYAGSRVLTSYLREPVGLEGDLLDHLRRHAQLQVLQQFAQLLAVNQVDCRCAVSRGLLLGVGRVRSGGQEQAFVRAANHRPAEVPDIFRADIALPLLALEVNLERQ